MQKSIIYFSESKKEEIQNLTELKEELTRNNTELQETVTEKTEKGNILTPGS